MLEGAADVKEAGSWADGAPVRQTEIEDPTAWRDPSIILIEELARRAEPDMSVCASVRPVASWTPHVHFPAPQKGPRLGFA